ncbi:[acyl-carrier-protein] S-malonyltransferase [Clostridium sp. USBA 49]|jgi:[acyl-carrier-protein] S-malonyltransferase|uniref:ACP S-malonyltransferase n=1 Tax=Clostridium TaxID=1485 RepID=UPI00099A7AC3|nr:MULTISPECIES: ACP S-malonyltransferase [Clostridium]SKA78112.1 [acyl-carrier-protein] S-malonyltransferase [Clostridium sp. USBA 49]
MGKVAFVFAGQGSQYVGMGKELADNIKVCYDIFDEADKALGFEISKICFEGPKDALDITENTQPAILTVSIACLKALEEKGIVPDVTAGLSLGEYSALVCSGVLNFSDAVRLVKKRGKFMQEAVPIGVGTMAAILGLDAEDVRKICAEAGDKGIVEPANFNCPGQIVIGGEIAAVEAASKIAKERGAKVIPLSVSAPFHTSMLESAAEKLKEELKNVELNNINIPYITNVTAQYVEETSEIKGLLEKQVKSSVLWENSIRRMLEDGVDTFVELGPGKVLSGFIKKINRKVKVLNVEDLKSLEKTLEILNSQER